MSSGSEFDSDTAVEKKGDNAFRGEVTDRWNTFAGPDGGYVLATIARAALESLPLPDPLAIDAHFLRPVATGELSITTEVVRVGRRHATASMSAFQNDKEVIRATVTAADLEQAAGRTEQLEAPLQLPDPESSPDPLEDFGDISPSIAHRVDYRFRDVPGWAQGKPSGSPTHELWMRFRDGRQPDPLSLLFFVDAAPPAILEIGELGSSTVQLSVHVRGRPAPGWLACRLATRHVLSGYHEEDMDIWDSKGNLVAQSRQLALLR